MAHFEIQDLTFTYPTAGGRPSLTDVSLSIAPGSTWCSAAEAEVERLRCCGT